LAGTRVDGAGIAIVAVSVLFATGRQAGGIIGVLAHTIRTPVDCTRVAIVTGDGLNAACFVHTHARDAWIAGSTVRVVQASCRTVGDRIKCTSYGGITEVVCGTGFAINAVGYGPCAASCGEIAMIERACIVIKTVHIIGTTDGTTRCTTGRQIGCADGWRMTPITEVICAWVAVLTHVVGRANDLTTTGQGGVFDVETET